MNGGEPTSAARRGGAAARAAARRRGEAARRKRRTASGEGAGEIFGDAGLAGFRKLWPGMGGNRFWGNSGI